jgi:hypothetical protein
VWRKTKNVFVQIEQRPAVIPQQPARPKDRWRHPSVVIAINSSVGRDEIVKSELDNYGAKLVWQAERRTLGEINSHIADCVSPLLIWRATCLLGV